MALEVILRPQYLVVYRAAFRFRFVDLKVNFF